MIVINGLRRLKKPVKASVVTAGVFDGVHLGHRKVITETVKRARALGLKSVVLTFDPHPARVLHPLEPVPSLISLGHRIKLIGELGADIIVVANFSESFAGLSAEEFVKDVLVTKLGAREVCVSEGFFFGKGAAAGLTLLKKFGIKYGFKVNVVRPVKIDSGIVSSSRIRKAITGGQIRLAERYLGRPVSILGTVIRGISLASELGYPTANINPHHEVVPPSGVYAVKVSFKGRVLKGVLNIGIRPTFFAPRDLEPSIEVHIFNFRQRIYGEDLEVLFVKKIRAEVRFGNRQDLVKRIRHDADMAKSILK